MITYFASGSSAPADIRGFARIGHPFGVSLPELSATAIEMIERLTAETTIATFVDLGVAIELTRPVQVFVDTGAFSEVEMGPDGPVVVRPISDEAWEKRMGMARRIAGALGSRAYVMAPDRVGDQDETLRRLRSHVGMIGEMRAAGAKVVVAIQRGAKSRAVFDREVCEALGFDDFVRGIPGNKAAGAPWEVEEYLRSVRPSAVHVLGMGPRSPRFSSFEHLFRRFIPQAAISCDSNALAAMSGHTNGREGGPRHLTAAMSGTGPFAGCGAWSREEAIALTFGPAMYFQAMVRALSSCGLVTMESVCRDLVADGIWTAAQARKARRPVQTGLFDNACDEDQQT